MNGRLAVLIATALLLSAGALGAQQGPAKTQPKTSTAPAAQPAAPAPQAQGKMMAAAPKWTKEQIKEAQEGLKRAKVFTGQPNGILGPQTRRAIRTFQRGHKLAVTGQLSDSLLAMLKAVP